MEILYREHSEYPHEIAYAHVNKSVLVQGEQFAFTAYVYDRNLKRPSFLTRNLYFQLTSENGTVMEEAMLLVNNGSTETVVELDSTYAAGNYKMKLFTRWMKNQSDKPEFTTEIKVLSKENSLRVTEEVITKPYDMQYFAEGGKLLMSVNNTLGILIKDSKGRGVEINNGELLAGQKVISSFSTNEMGSSRVYFTPEPGTSYSIKAVIDGKTIIKSINDILDTGMILSVNPLGNEIGITLSTNSTSLSQVDGDYKVAVHDDLNLQVIVMPVKKLSQTTFLSANEVSPGINMVTVFNEEGEPILERTFFNYKNLPKSNIASIQANTVLDSINVELQLDKKFKYEAPNKVSLSIFPVSTKAIDRNNSLVSRFFLGSHIKGTVENPSYYFNDINRRVKYDMDNLMITQGWTGYEWDKLFGPSNKPTYSFDQGISFKAQINSRNTSQFMIYPLNNSTSAIVDLKEGSNFFTATELYAIEGDELRVSGINKKGKNIKPNLYPTFEPRAIPRYDSNAPYLELPVEPVLEDLNIGSFFQGAQELEAVIVKADVEKERFQKIIDRERGSVDVFDDKDRAKYYNLATYLSRRGFNTSSEDGIFTITSNSRGNGGVGSPSILIDDAFYSDPSILTTLDPSIIDYVVINRDGIGERLSNKFGIIKIYTNPLLSPIRSQDAISTAYQVPLKFSKKKLYYRPEYGSYNSDFFKQVGIIHFLTDNDISEDGKVNFGFPNLLKDEYLVVLEGWTADGVLISEVFEIKM
ncbi:hypothetical protein [Nonlabens marinus]|nr:hypothetical protein [Nonlabens marinus]